ncbi:MAG: RHS repeat domain-containing protein [Bacteroidota bacterium]
MKKIKSIQTIQTEIDGTSFISEFLEYDKDGNMVVSIKYDADGKVIEKTENVYSDGKKITEKNYLSEDELAEEHHFEYDGNGKLLKEAIKYAEGYEAIRKFTRDEENRELRVEEVDEEGDTESFTVHKFNENEQLTEKAEFDHRGKLHTAIRLYYNDEGQVVRQEEFEKKMKKPVIVREYSFNENGDIKGMLVRNRKGKPIDKYTLEYDDEGRLLKQHSAQSGTITHEYEDGKLKKEIIADANGNIQSDNAFDYDEAGNIIREKNQMVQKDFKIQYFE